MATHEQRQDARLTRYTLHRRVRRESEEEGLEWRPRESARLEEAGLETEKVTHESEDPVPEPVGSGSERHGLATELERV